MGCGALAGVQEIAANHVLEDFIIDPRIDANSDLDVPTQSLLHIHCQQGANRFNKGYFEIHRYDFLDLSTLNGTIAKDCATLLAVGSYRLTMGLPSTGNPAAEHLDQAVRDAIKARDAASSRTQNKDAIKYHAHREEL